MTSLAQLYLCGSGGLKLDLCCDHLRELRVLTLRSIGIAQLEGQVSSLVNLKKLSFSNYCQESSNRQQLGALQTQNMHSLPSLASIDAFHCDGIPEVLFRLGRFPSLRALCISSCHVVEFTSYEDSWLGQLSSLEDLELNNCECLICLPRSLSTLSSLKKFSLKGCSEIRSLPQGGLPRSLKELFIIDCSAELMQGCQPNSGAEWSKISHVPCIRVKMTN